MQTETASTTMPEASEEYRKSRDALMSAEIDLRAQRERVAELRRAMPPGPVIPDYIFLDGEKQVRLCELFDGKRYLVMYHLMYWADDDEFCPMCSMWVDSLDGVAHHIEQNAAIAVASLAPVDILEAWKAHRGWRRLRVLADADPTFARDTGAEDAKGDPQPTVLVFEKTADGIRHVYTQHAEDRGGNRAIDLLCPTWHVLDLLPSGRGDWNASNDYIQ